MNKAILMGRLTKDPELRRTNTSGIPVVSFTLAVDRRFKSQNGERETDFISLIAWRQQAEFVAKYLHQGSKICVVGTLQTRSYEKNGEKRYVTEVVVEEVYFAESKNGSAQGSNSAANYTPTAKAQGQAPVQANDAFDMDNGDEFFKTSGSDDVLPFSL